MPRSRDHRGSRAGGSQSWGCSLVGMSEISVTTDAAPGVAVVEIQRGPHNFFDLGMFTDIADALETLADGDTRAVVLCSEGKNFCAGADFSGRSTQPQGAGAPHLYDVA